MIKLTTIIPLFNGEKYIINCLECVTRQGLEPNEHEIIVVDDGSSDNGPALVRKFKEGYPNVILISKENGGVSSARNVGIDNASGEYIHFMDADDRLIDDSYSYLLKEGGGASIIQFGSITVDNRIKTEEVINQYNENPVWTHFGSTNDYINAHGSLIFVWGCLYKHTLLKEVRFRPYRISEDVLFNIDLLCKFQKISFSVTSKIVYKYILHRGSAMTQSSKSHLREAIYNMYEVWDVVEQKKKFYPVFDKYFEVIQNNLQRQSITRILSGTFSLSEFNKMISEGYKKRIYPLKVLNTKSDKVIDLLVRCPIIIWMLSPMYRYLFLPFIKPFIKRN